MLFFQDSGSTQPGQDAEPVPRIGCQVLLTVLGEITREGAIKGFEVESEYLYLWGPDDGRSAGWPACDIRYRLAVENTGNVHITVLAKIYYRASIGFGSGSVDLGTMTILPGTVRYFEGSLPAPPLLGRFEAKATVSYGPDQFTYDVERNASTDFTVFPLLWIILAAIILLAAWMTVRTFRVRAKDGATRH